MASPSRQDLRIHLLGGFSVDYDGDQLPPLASRPARLLFAFLALHAGRPQPRSLLATQLWPDASESRARRRLSHALWQIQDALSELVPGRSHIVTSGDSIVFDADSPYWLDVEEFHRRLDQVDAGGELDAAAVRELRRCVELYRGDLLAGHYEPWVLEEQAYVEHRYINALSRLVEGSKQRGNFEDALTFARRLTNHAPLREDAHREVMRLCVLLGRPSEALDQYERCRSVLLEELEAEPAADTAALYEQIAQVRDVSSPRVVPVTELVSRRLVARDAERIALVDELERTLAGRTGTVFVEGEPGVGKTQLLAQIAEDARWRGFSVLWGRCTGAAVPFGAIRSALSDVLDPVRVAQLQAQLAPVWIRGAGAVLPPLAPATEAPDHGRRPRPGGRPAAEAADVTVESLVQVLTALAELDPVLLVIEDVHDADAETLEVLGAIARRSGGGRLLAVLSFRDVEARDDDDRWRALRLLDRDARPVRVRLEALTSFETAAFLREVLGANDVPAVFAAAVHRESGGNPLYALELLRSLRDQQILTEQAADQLEVLDVPVTEDLRTVIGRRLDTLGEDDRGFLEVVAVLGHEGDLDTIGVAVGETGTPVVRGLNELTRRNVLENRGDRYGFTHAATRRVVLDALPEGRRRQLHLQVADALERVHPDRVEALADHLQQGGSPRRALPYVRQAAVRALAVNAYATAAQHLETARHLLDEVPVSVDERFRVVADLEQVLGVLGRRDDQARSLDELAALVGEHRDRQVEQRLRRAVFLGHRDQFEEAIGAARSGVALAEGPAQRGRALTALGQVLGWAGEHSEAVTVLAEAAEVLEDPHAESEARFALGTSLRFLQRHEPAEQELEASLALAEERDDARGIVEALGALANVRSELGRTEQAIVAYERAIALAREIGYRHREAVSLVDLGTARLAAGEPASALEAYESALRRFEELGNPRGQAITRLNRAWLLHRWLGDDAAARTNADAAHRHFHETGNRGIVAIALQTLAAIETSDGRHVLASQHLDAALEAARSAQDRRAEVQVRWGTAMAQLAVSEPEAALRELAIAENLATELGLAEYAAELASLRALALLELSPAEAWAAAEAALGALSASPEPHRIHHRVAQVASALGRANRAQHHRLAAAGLLERAVDGFDSEVRQRALEDVPVHRDILTESQRVRPRELTVRLAAESVPHVRAATEEELVDVALRLGPEPEGPAERRQQLVEVVRQASRQGAAPTVADLAQILQVSSSTVRRDIRAVRADGHSVSTRGSRAG